eukprot:11189610-Lingulodinium_polyedra.AAC.1
MSLRLTSLPPWIADVLGRLSVTSSLVCVCIALRRRLSSWALSPLPFWSTSLCVVERKVVFNGGFLIEHG